MMFAQIILVSFFEIVRMYVLDRWKLLSLIIANAKGRPAGPGQRHHGSSFVAPSPLGAGPLALPRVHAYPSKSHQRMFTLHLHFKSRVKKILD